MTLCKGCGAPLEWSKGNTCEYCGTQFRKPREDFFIDMSTGKGVLKLGKDEFRVALMSIRGEDVMGDTYRDAQGMMRCDHRMKHTFTLVEV